MDVKEVIYDNGSERRQNEEELITITVDESLKYGLVSFQASLLLNICLILSVLTARALTELISGVESRNYCLVPI